VPFHLRVSISLGSCWEKDGQIRAMQLRAPFSPFCLGQPDTKGLLSKNCPHSRNFPDSLTPQDHSLSETLRHLWAHPLRNKSVPRASLRLACSIASPVTREPHNFHPPQDRLPGLHSPKEGSGTGAPTRVLEKEGGGSQRKGEDRKRFPWHKGTDSKESSRPKWLSPGKTVGDGRGTRLLRRGRVG
jgi:hypothetical protein